MPRSEHLLVKKEIGSSVTTGGGQIGWRGTAAVLPGVGLALLPKLTCPACWPAYAGVLSSLGLGFVNYNPYLLPLTALFLLLAVASLGFRAKRRRGYGPFILGTVAALILLIGKFLFASDAALYVGIALLMAASLWNSWPLRNEGSGSCPACTSWAGGAKSIHKKGGDIMNAKREIEVFSAGCPACDETVRLVKRIACPSCEVTVRDVKEPEVAARAKNLGIHSVPAVAIDGQLADCCAKGGPDEATLRAAGIGQPLP